MKVVCFFGTGSRGSVKVDNLEAQGGPGVRKLVFFGHREWQECKVGFFGTGSGGSAKLIFFLAQLFC